MTNVNRNPPAICPGCGERLDANMAIDGGDTTPVAGDPSICAYCGTIATFQADGSLRRPTPDELRDFMQDMQIRQIVRAIYSRLGQVVGLGRRRRR